MKKITKALLQQVYSQTNQSGLQVARELKISRTQLGRYLDKFEIKHKTISEVMKGRVLTYTHRMNIKKTRRDQRGSKNPYWKGDKKYTSKEGYVYLRLPNHPRKLSNGSYAEHRYVMEQKIGRYLTTYEHIHHINGIKNDNRPENLELVNGQTHNLITRMESRIRELEEENRKLKERLEIEIIY